MKYISKPENSFFLIMRSFFQRTPAKSWKKDYKTYAEQLCSVLRQSAKIVHEAKLARISRKTLELGSFDVISGKVSVSDPCYDRDVWCRGELSNVKKGTWYASIIEHDEGEWGRRIARLMIVHEGYEKDETLIQQKAPFEVGVDSGQAGFFDSDHYQDSSVLPDAESVSADNPTELWYSHCCDITLSPIRAGVLPYGVVSSSGFGDGSYDCFYYSNQEGEIVKAEIEFLPEEEYDE